MCHLSKDLETERAQCIRAFFFVSQGEKMKWFTCLHIDGLFLAIYKHFVTILRVGNVCRPLRATVGTHHRCVLDCASLSKPNFYQLVRVIPPEFAMALTLSDGEKTPGQIDVFLSLSPVEITPSFERTAASPVSSVKHRPTNSSSP